MSSPGTTEASILVGQPAQPPVAYGCRPTTNRAEVISPTCPSRSARNPVPIRVVRPMGQ